VVKALRLAKVALSGATSELFTLSRARAGEGKRSEVTRRALRRVDDLWLELDGLMRDLERGDERWKAALSQGEPTAEPCEALEGTPSSSPARPAEPPSALRLVPPTARSLLVIDDRLYVARGLERVLRGRADVRIASSREEVAWALERRVPDAVVCELRLGGETTAPLLQRLAERHPDVRRVLYSAARPAAWTPLLARGLVHKVVRKPGKPEQILAAASAERQREAQDGPIIPGGARRERAAQGVHQVPRETEP
jgi:ActR/RegA family two-component response regulator